MRANVHEAHIAVKPACAWSGMAGAAVPVHDMHMATSAKRKVLEKTRAGSAYQPTFMRAWREFRSKTLEDMAEFTGIKHGQLSRIERGIQPYSQKILETYSKELGCSVIDLLARKPGEAENLLSLWPRLDDRARKMVEAAIKSAAD